MSECELCWKGPYCVMVPHDALWHFCNSKYQCVLCPYQCLYSPHTFVCHFHVYRCSVAGVKNYWPKIKINLILGFILVIRNYWLLLDHSNMKWLFEDKHKITETSPGGFFDWCMESQPPAVMPGNKGDKTHTINTRSPHQWTLRLRFFGEGIPCVPSRTCLLISLRTLMVQCQEMSNTIKMRWVKKVRHTIHERWPCGLYCGVGKKGMRSHFWVPYY